jgi:chromosome partitioning protein
VIVCFATHKGGTGKTTSSINLAAGLARAGKSTLLIDLDPQGHSTLGMGVELDDDDINVADALSKRALPLADVIQTTATPGLDIAPSTLRLASVAESLSTMLKREERLAKVVASTTRYEWIVIDCPPMLGVLTANAVAASNLALVPCPTGARALDGLEDLLDLVYVLKGERYPHWRVLLTMVDPRKTVTQEIFQEQLRPFERMVLTTKILTSEALNQSQMAKRDVYTFDPRSRGAANYEALTKELLRHFSKG